MNSRKIRGSRLRGLDRKDPSTGYGYGENHEHWKSYYHRLLNRSGWKIWASTNRLYSMCWLRWIHSINNAVVNEARPAIQRCRMMTTTGFPKETSLAIFVTVRSHDLPTQMTACHTKPAKEKEPYGGNPFLKPWRPPLQPFPKRSRRFCLV